MDGWIGTALGSFAGIGFAAVLAYVAAVRHWRRERRWHAYAELLHAVNRVSILMETEIIDRYADDPDGDGISPGLWEQWRNSVELVRAKCFEVELLTTGPVAEAAEAFTLLEEDILWKYVGDDHFPEEGSPPTLRVGAVTGLASCMTSSRRLAPISADGIVCPPYASRQPVVKSSRRRRHERSRGEKSTPERDL